MYYRIKRRGAVDGGHAEVDIVPIGDVYLIKYKIEVRIGRGFFSVTKKNGGSIKVEKRLLTEAYVRKHDRIRIQGLDLRKQSNTKFSFTKRMATGTVDFEFDGKDPVEVKSLVLKVPALPTLILYKT